MSDVKGHSKLHFKKHTLIITTCILFFLIVIGAALIAFVAPAESRMENVTWSELTDDEKVSYVISQIQEFPTVEDVESNIEAFDDSGDTDGLESYYYSIYSDVSRVLYNYNQLSEEL